MTAIAIAVREYKGPSPRQHTFCLSVAPDPEAVAFDAPVNANISATLPDYDCPKRRDITHYCPNKLEAPFPSFTYPYCS